MHCNNSDTNTMVRKLPKKRKFDPSELDDPLPHAPATPSMVNSPEVQHITNLDSDRVDKTQIVIMQNPTIMNHPSVLRQPPPLQQSSPPMQAAAVDYSRLGLASAKLSQQPREVESPPEVIEDNTNAYMHANNHRTSKFAHNRQNTDTFIPPIDLNEWRDHRVLAKYNGVYLPGKQIGFNLCRLSYNLY